MPPSECDAPSAPRGARGKETERGEKKEKAREVMLAENKGELQVKTSKKQKKKNDSPIDLPV